MTLCWMGENSCEFKTKMDCRHFLFVLFWWRLEYTVSIRKNDLHALHFNPTFYFTILVALLFLKCNKHFAGTSHIFHLHFNVLNFPFPKGDGLAR
jgi:hypothetical protein